MFSFFPHCPDGGNLKSMGVQFVQEVTRFPGLSIAYIMAPDNVIIEIMERK
jgi:hypothetical protein